MAVLCDSYSIIIKRKAIDNFYRGGWDNFLKNLPNASMCTDEEIVRIGFLDPQKLNKYLDELLNFGLRHDSVRGDLVLFDQDKGPINKCNWLQYTKVKVAGSDYKMPICWLLERNRETNSSSGIVLKASSMNIATPIGWTHERAQLKHGKEAKNLADQLFYQGNKDGLDVYWNPITNEELFTTKTEKKIGSSKNLFKIIIPIVFIVFITILFEFLLM